MRSLMRSNLRCPLCRAGELDAQADALCCAACRRSYPVRDGVADLRPPQTANRGQIEFYNEDCEVYDHLVSDSTFWRASDEQTIGRWVGEIRPEDRVLDLGCGTGRCTVRLARVARQVTALDISDGMVRHGRRKVAAAGLQDRVEWLLADAEALPFPDASFDVVVGFGIYHHVASPERLMREVARVLAPGGRLYALENNDTPFRCFFDWLMKVKRLWNEEANSPLLKAGDMQRWAAAGGLRLQTSSSTFLPPHLFNLMPLPTARWWLARTDRWAERMPGLRSRGGQLIIRGVKVAPSAAATA